MLLFFGQALAGDLALYQRALALVDEHYLQPARVDHERMLLEAGRQLERSVEWLLVEEGNGGTLQLRDGAGQWEATVSGAEHADLAHALSALEDAVRLARRTSPPGVDLRVEILRGVVGTLDRHSAVLHARGLERFDERLSGTLTGIGVSFRRVEGDLLVDTVAGASPAERGGVQPGDRLLRVDGVSTVGMTPADAGARIRGAEGTPVALTLRRGSEILELSLLREEVRIRNVRGSALPQGLGLLDIDHFSEQTHEWLLTSLEDLSREDALRRGVVLDVRGNTGGSLIQSAEAADTFLQGGLIVSTAGRDGEPVVGLVARLDAQPDAHPYAMPLAVLMSHASASGAEILAGSLARLDRALLVGSTSYGKGTVQKVYQLAPDIKLKLTVAEYRLEGDTRVMDVGLAPDLALTPYVFDADGAWYPELSRERARLGPGTAILPAVEEAAGWRTTGETPPARDTALDLAARLLGAAEGASRTRLLETLALLRPRLEDAEDARVVEAFGARGIDWAPAPRSAPPTASVQVRLDTHLLPGPGADGAVADTDERGDGRRGPVAGEQVELVASVRNEGSALYRAAIRLRSVNRLWDDQLLPLGYLPPESARTGSVRVSVPAGSPSRTDEVEMLLEAAGVPAHPIGRTRLAVEGGPLPMVAATARVVGTGGRGDVLLTVENRSTTELRGVRGHFEFPEVDGIEFIDDGTQPVTLAPGASETFVVRLLVADAWTDPKLPLDLVWSAEGWGTLARWAVELPRDGGAIRLEPPALLVRPLPTVAAPGSTVLSIRATDDRGLDHLVVSGGPETVDRSRYEPSVDWRPDKLAWKEGSGRRDELQVTVPVAPGQNRYEVTVQDRSGIRTGQTLYILGSTPLAADADDAGR